MPRMILKLHQNASRCSDQPRFEKLGWQGGSHEQKTQDDIKLEKLYEQLRAVQSEIDRLQKREVVRVEIYKDAEIHKDMPKKVEQTMPSLKKTSPIQRGLKKLRYKLINSQLSPKK